MAKTFWKKGKREERNMDKGREGKVDEKLKIH